MQLAQKISVSLDTSILDFIDRYRTTHAAKGRSAVIATALQLLQRLEQERYLAEAYAESAEQDRQMAAEWDVALADGLETERAERGVVHETW